MPEQLRRVLLGKCSDALEAGSFATFI